VKLQKNEIIVKAKILIELNRKKRLKDFTNSPNKLLYLKESTAEW